MTTRAPGVDAALTSRDVDYDDLLPVAAVPVPILYRDAQAAMACGAWAEAGEFLGEVVRLEPGFGNARELLAQARRAYARAMLAIETVIPAPPAAILAIKTVIPAPPTRERAAAASAAPVLGPTATPTVLRLVPPTPAREPTLAEPELAPATPVGVVAPQLDQPPVSAPAPEATPEEVVIRQPPTKQNVSR